MCGCRLNQDFRACLVGLRRKCFIGARAKDLWGVSAGTPMGFRGPTSGDGVELIHSSVAVQCLNVAHRKRRTREKKDGCLAV